jgi:hypothetical protein
MSEVVLPLASYPEGNTNFDPVAVPDDAISVRFQMRRCTAAASDIWPDAETFGHVDTEISIDGGAFETLQNGNVEGWGAIQQNKFGQDITHMWFDGVDLPAGVNRQMRGTLFVADGPLRSEGELIFSTDALMAAPTT